MNEYEQKQNRRLNVIIGECVGNYVNGNFKDVWLTLEQLTPMQAAFVAMEICGELRKSEQALFRQQLFLRSIS